MSGRRPAPRFVLCVSNARYRASLIPRRIYPVVQDDTATVRGLVRVIDESGEDYLFPTALFVDIELPDRARWLLAKRPSRAPRRGSEKPRS